MSQEVWFGIRICLAMALIATVPFAERIFAADDPLVRPAVIKTSVEIEMSDSDEDEAAMPFNPGNAEDFFNGPFDAVIMPDSLSSVLESLFDFVMDRRVLRVVRVVEENGGVPDPDDGEVLTRPTVGVSARFPSLIDLATFNSPLMWFKDLAVATIDQLYGDLLADPVAEIDEDGPEVLEQINEFQPQLKTELKFVRLICSDLSFEQKQKILDATNAAVKKFAIKLCNIYAGRLQPVGLDGEPTDETDVVAPIREAICNTMKEILADDEMSRFLDENQRRLLDRKDAVVINMVSRLDGHLCLEEDQRVKIQQSFKTNWQPSWEQWLSTLHFDDQYLPYIPDEYVSPFLTPDQNIVWEGLPTGEFGWWGGGNAWDGNADDDAWWGIENDHNNPAIEFPGGPVMMAPQWGPDIMAPDALFDAIVPVVNGVPIAVP